MTHKREEVERLTMDPLVLDHAEAASPKDKKEREDNDIAELPSSNSPDGTDKWRLIMFATFITMVISGGDFIAIRIYLNYIIKKIYPIVEDRIIELFDSNSGWFDVQYGQAQIILDFLHNKEISYAYYFGIVVFVISVVVFSIAFMGCLYREKREKQKNI